MKIFAFAGSNSAASINHQLVEHTINSFENCDVNIIDLKDYEAPVFSVDLEKAEGHPEAAFRFLNCIADADAIVCSLAEHNRSYCAAFKSLFDWASRINGKVFQEKPMLLMTTSPGGFGGGNVMKEASTFFPQFGAEIKASFSLPKFYETFQKGEGIIDAEQAEKHQAAIALFKSAINIA